MYTLVKLIIVASAIYVYHDASKNKIGRIPGQSGFFNLPAGAWALGTLWLWLIFFPMYLKNREELIRKAQEHPREATYIKLKLGILAFMFVALMFQGISGENDGQTADGQLIFKGLYLGMPVEEAAIVMLNNGLPPGGGSDSPYEKGGPWDGNTPLQLSEKGEDGSSFLRRSGCAIAPDVSMYSWWIMKIDANGTVIEFTLMADAVNVLFNTGDMSADDFAQMFIDAYGIPELAATAKQTNEMEQYFSDKFVKLGWEYIDRDYGWGVTISDTKILKVFQITRANETQFN